MRDDNIALYAFRKNGDTAMQAAFACLGNQQDAEDVVQETFFELHKKPHDFTSFEDIKEALFAKESDSLGEIISMIRSLPPPYNAVVYLHDCEDYTIREIAEMLDFKEKTVRSQLRRGCQKLRMEIKESGGPQRKNKITAAPSAASFGQKKRSGDFAGAIPQRRNYAA